MSDVKTLAEVLFPDITLGVEDLEKKYPARVLPVHAQVTRFAPSPTGFLHTGSLFTALVARTVAHQSGGVFFLRLEDTDTKREVAGSEVDLVNQLRQFEVAPDEGFLGTYESGNYGPYCQSDRASIYRTVIKSMVEKGIAYPCFATPGELDQLRALQEAQKVMPGYYGKYAKYRDFPVEQAIALVKQGTPYVLRFKSPGNHENYIEVDDLIRGHLRLSENDQDIVILKGDGLPTYHFAHVVDDHFMHTTLVSRGEEWLPSLPIHVQMFKALNWIAPKYAHLPVINKLDNGSKRKLSKRKDPEAAVSYFLKEGYPIAAVKEYLLTIANSNFEEWRMKNPSSPVTEFAFDISRMTLDGALFDFGKINFISKEIIARMSVEHLFVQTFDYAKTYEPNLRALIDQDHDYYKKILGIERNRPNPRKDYAKYSDIYPAIKLFYSEEFDQLMANAAPFNPVMPKEKIIECLTVLNDQMKLLNTEETWFAHFKELGLQLKFAGSGKEFKANPTQYAGHIGDLAEILRITLTSSKQSPSLFEIMTVLGEKEVKARLSQMIQKLQGK